jgi:hypothetical protein
MTDLTPKVPGSITLTEAPSPSPPGRYRGKELWAHRISVLLFVFFCATLGILLVILPWSPRWTDNHLLLQSPGLQAFVAHPFVRGMCSGLGLLDIGIGFWEAIRYNEDKSS